MRLLHLWSIVATDIQRRCCPKARPAEHVRHWAVHWAPKSPKPGIHRRLPSKRSMKTGRSGRYTEVVHAFIGRQWFCMPKLRNARVNDEPWNRLDIASITWKSFLHVLDVMGLLHVLRLPRLHI